MYQQDEDRTILRDNSGQLVAPGQFVEFLLQGAEVPAGPYKYEGFRYGSHRFSVPGICFVHSEFTFANLELLPWKRWRKPDYHTDRMIEYMEQRRAPREKAHCSVRSLLSPQCR